MVTTNFPIHGWIPKGYLSLPNGYTVEYTSLGSGDPIVVVPGLAGGIALLEPVLCELAKSYRVIAYQLRGENQGMFDRQFSIRRLIEDLDEVISALHLERPGLCGFSFGAAIALDYATRFSHKLAFCVVQGAGKCYRPSLIGNVARAVLDRLPLPIDNPFINQFFRLLTGGKKTGKDQMEFIVPRLWQTDQSVMAHRLAMLEDEYDLGERLWSVRAPTLVLSGANDVIVSNHESQELASAIAHSQFSTIPNAGHLAFVTHAKQVAGHVRAFNAKQLVKS